MSMDPYTWNWDIISCCYYSPTSLLLILLCTRRSGIALQLSKVCSSACRSSLNYCAFHTFGACRWLLGHFLLFRDHFFQYIVLKRVSSGPRFPPHLWRVPRLKRFFLFAHFNSKVPGHVQPRIQSNRATTYTVILYVKEPYIHVLSLAWHSKSIWKLLDMLKWGPRFNTETLS